MSVLSRRHTVPVQRSADPREAVDTPLPIPRPATRERVVPPTQARPPARRRAALVVAAGVLTIGAGTGVYLIADSGSSEPAAPAAPAAPAFDPATEAQRDAAMARRGPGTPADASRTTEAQRDAAMARRGPGTPADARRTTEALRDAATAARSGTGGQSGSTPSGTGLIP